MGLQQALHRSGGPDPSLGGGYGFSLLFRSDRGPETQSGSRCLWLHPGAGVLLPGRDRLDEAPPRLEDPPWLDAVHSRGRSFPQPGATGLLTTGRQGDHPAPGVLSLQRIDPQGSAAGSGKSPDPRWRPLHHGLRSAGEADRRAYPSHYSLQPPQPGGPGVVQGGAGTPGGDMPTPQHHHPLRRDPSRSDTEGQPPYSHRLPVQGGRQYHRNLYLGDQDLQPGRSRLLPGHRLRQAAAGPLPLHPAEHMDRNRQRSQRRGHRNGLPVRGELARAGSRVRAGKLRLSRLPPGGAAAGSPGIPPGGDLSGLGRPAVPGHE